MRWSISLLVCTIAAAGPVEFGLRAYDAAVAARNLKWKVKYELTLDPPETFRIEPYKVGGAHVTGGDLRGLMYGLLEAADQMRSTGHLKQVHAEPGHSRSRRTDVCRRRRSRCTGVLLAILF